MILFYPVLSVGPMVAFILNAWIWIPYQIGSQNYLKVRKTCLFFLKKIITVIVTVTIIKQRNDPQSWTKILAIAEKKAENVQLLVGRFYQLSYEAIYFITNCYYHYYCYNYCCYLC